MSTTSENSGADFPSMSKAHGGRPPEALVLPREFPPWNGMDHRSLLSSNQQLKKGDVSRSIRMEAWWMRDCARVIMACIWKGDHNVEDSDRQMGLQMNDSNQLEQEQVGIVIDGTRQDIEYEGLPSICFSCGKYGHSREICGQENINDGEGGIQKEERDPKELYGSWMQVVNRRRRGIVTRSIDRSGVDVTNRGKGPLVSATVEDPSCSIIRHEQRVVEQAIIEKTRSSGDVQMDLDADTDIVGGEDLGKEETVPMLKSRTGHVFPASIHGNHAKPPTKVSVIASELDNIKETNKASNRSLQHYGDSV
ncbi:hypothetical protein V6N13_051157 [Hibiscus sabdariffa]